jgi:predicted site-specific integrase-resolvase
MAILVSIGKIATLFGVTAQTIIRNWEKQGILKSERTAGNHRRFDLHEIEKSKGNYKEEEKTTVLYSRVSSHDQKEDLTRQTEELKKYCASRKIEKYEVIEDLGSGINYQKRGLKKLIRQIMFGTVARIVITYKDRLVRFGSEILYQICKWKNVEIVVLQQDTEKRFEAKLVEDVLAILTVYSSKIYGRRSHSKAKEAICG